MATTEMNCLASGGGGHYPLPATVNGTTISGTFDIKAKCFIVIATLSSTARHIFMFDVNSNTVWFANGSNILWQSMQRSQLGFTSYTITDSGFEMDSGAAGAWSDATYIPLAEYPDGYFT